MKVLTTEELVVAAEDLNKVLGLNPPIVVGFDEKEYKGIILINARKKFVAQLKKDLFEIATGKDGKEQPLLQQTDTILKVTASVLENLGVKDIRKRVLIKEEDEDKSQSAEKKHQVSEDKKISGEKTEEKKAKKAEAKGTGAKKKADLDEYGLPVGSKRSQAIKLLATGKYRMVDLKKKYGATFYDPLKKAAAAGFTVKKDGKNYITITGKVK